MKDLTPRLVDEAESKRLGVQHGWYGTRVSGTFMTASCATYDECLDAIEKLPEPVAKAAVPHADKPHLNDAKPAAPSMYQSYAQLSAVRVGYAPSRLGKRQ
jgi:hypothetical protein